ncbi:MAG: bifunctional hydroxymethylpyrimidine kinase/phosphomethylpyrimidine kinase [Verrucomicrobia bacterium]|nr:bifunctional hydroxymethylpyrimidine kinase/phosphomethylpyrimidine kinase [Verrucomicrobiota bacterium]MDA1087814.1 bifunctional hydroxymethylpyrimidine kinase/phosphomethylpyrimidine kinase [Verrucomicrobiota bacterium]
MTPGGDKPPAVLSIAGSDSGGGAGIQADLKTFQDFGIWGTTAVTCVTAQSPSGVSGIAPMDPDLVVKQIAAVREAYSIRAAKTGMLFSTEIIEAVCTELRLAPIASLVVDPVMVATSGARLLRDDAIQALCEQLLPLATVITPNLPEAEVLCGQSIVDASHAQTAAREIGERYHAACVIKGGHGDGETARDILWDGEQLIVLEIPRITGVSVHGTGCTYSSALTALLAQDTPLEAAARRAQQYVGQKLRVESGASGR